jgi:hypothetical protein
LVVWWFWCFWILSFNEVAYSSKEEEEEEEESLTVTPGMEA